MCPHVGGEFSYFMLPVAQFFVMIADIVAVSETCLITLLQFGLVIEQTKKNRMYSTRAPPDKPEN